MLQIIINFLTVISLQHFNRFKILIFLQKIPIRLALVNHLFKLLKIALSRFDNSRMHSIDFSLRSNLYYVISPQELITL